MAVHGVERDDAVCKIDFLKKLLRRRNLVGFLVDFDMRQHKRAVGGEPSPGAAVQKPVSSEPETQTTTAVFGDWTLRCQKSGVGAQARRSCEIDQSATVQGQSAPFSQIAVGKATPNDPLRVTVLVPANVAFPSSVRLLFDEKDNQSIDLIWARCLPGGCFAVETLTDEMLKRWRTLTPPAKASFKNGAGQDVVIPVSFRGFAQAIDALAKEK